MKVGKLLIVLCLTATAFFVFSAAAQKAYTQRRAQVEGMSQDQKDALRKHWDLFTELSEDKRDRLRRLHTDLESAPDGAALKEVLANYHEWVEDLPWPIRAQLQGLPVEERLTRVRELCLSSPDQEAVLAWFHHQLGRAGVTISREELDTLRQRDPHQKWQTLGKIWRNRRAFDVLTNKEVFAKALPELRRELAPPLRELLEKKTVDEQRSLVSWWIMGPMPFPRGGPFVGRGRELDEAGLERALERLPEEEQNRLKELPKEERLLELRRIIRERFGGGRGRQMGPENRGPGRDGSGPPMGRGRGEGGRGNGRTRLGPRSGDNPRPGEGFRPGDGPRRGEGPPLDGAPPDAPLDDPTPREHP